MTLADEDFESMFGDVFTDADDVVDGADNLYTWYMNCSLCSAILLLYM